jgi:hypothetical protein
LSKRLLLLLCFALLSSKIFAQDSLTIQLLTCNPGQDLYSIFGHSGIRVINHTSGTDEVYNYGMFNFDDPAFYTKYVRGKLMYWGAKQPISHFTYGYQMENRAVFAQELNINQDQAHAVLLELEKSIDEKNKYFHYDFLYKNCSTEARDLFERALGKDKIKYPEGKFYGSFITTLDRYLKNLHWERFGIDLLLSSEVRKNMSAKQSGFLPNELMKLYKSTNLDNKPLVLAETEIVPFAVNPNFERKESLFTPLTLCLGLLAISLLGFLSFLDKRIIKWFDAIFFTLLGMLGLLFLFMWFGTNHLQTKHNMHLLWCLPNHCFYTYFINSKYKKIYARIALSLSILSLIIIPFFQNTPLVFVLLILCAITRLFYHATRRDLQ